MESLTKIRSRHLKALERGEYDCLPGHIYIKGFLRTCARVLKMDSDKLIALYRAESNLTESNNSILDRMKGIREAKFVLTPKWLFVFFGVIVIFVIAGYLWYQVSGFAAAPALQLKKPTEEDFTTKQDQVIVEGSTDVGAMVDINEQPITTDLEGNFSERIKLKDGINQIIVTARNKIGREKSLAIKILAKIPQAKKSVLGVKKNQALILIINVKSDPAWISVDVDEKNIYKGIMLADTSQEFVAKKEIVINSGNAGSTYVYLNGNNLGVLGKKGELIKNKKYDLSILAEIKKGEYE